MKIKEKNVEVIYTFINDNLEKYEYYRSLLNKEELDKADRYYFQKDRNCYTVARGLLRIFIAEYLNINPKNTEFKYNEFGKPFIENSDIEFNISHSGDIIIFAFTLNNKIGVDIEFMKDKVKFKEIIHRFFSENEIKEFLTVEEEKQKEAFFNGWSRKEAYIKAVGKGLGIPLNSFDVSLDPDQEVKIKAIDGNINHSWYLYDLKIDKEYKSAFAIDSEVKTINISRI